MLKYDSLLSVLDLRAFFRTVYRLCIPESCRIHEQNRDGLGVSAGHVSELLSSILALGFVESECRGVCIELTSDSSGERTRLFNVRLAEESKGRLAAVQPEMIRYASVVGSHSNQVMRGFALGAAHTEPRVTVGGMLNLELLGKIDPAFAKAVREGVSWVIVSHKAQANMPEFAGLMQAAGNAAVQVAKPEDEAMHSICKSCLL